MLTIHHDRTCGHVTVTYDDHREHHLVDFGDRVSVSTKPNPGGGVLTVNPDEARLLAAALHEWADWKEGQ